MHVRGQVRIEAGPGAPAPRLFSFDGEHGFIDESAGYHARHTAWRWSAGVGRTGDGRTVAWNLVDGVHDAPEASERTVWIDGEPYEVEPQPFAARSVTGRRPRLRALVGARALDVARPRPQPLRAAVRDVQRRAAGRLELAEGYGVMEDHEVTW